MYNANIFIYLCIHITIVFMRFWANDFDFGKIFFFSNFYCQIVFPSCQIINL